MSPELSALTLAALLQMVQFVLMAVPANLEAGTARTLGPRDEDISVHLSQRTRRLLRALINHGESLPLFAIAVLVITLTGANSSLTGWLAWIYLVARVLYIPAYAFGWVPWRSLIWGTGYTSIAALLVCALWTVGLTLP
jgi:uncharacterized MAPEG superfamily protein